MAPAGGTYAFAMQDLKRAVADDRYKLLFSARTKQFELVDLRADPGERADVLAHNPEAFLRLQPLLKEWEMKMARGRPEELERAGQEVQERLRALGYLP